MDESVSLDTTTKIRDDSNLRRYHSGDVIKKMDSGGYTEDRNDDTQSFPAREEFQRQSSSEDNAIFSGFELKQDPICHADHNYVEPPINSQPGGSSIRGQSKVRVNDNRRRGMRHYNGGGYPSDSSSSVSDSIGRRSRRLKKDN